MELCTLGFDSKSHQLIRGMFIPYKCLGGLTRWLDAAQASFVPSFYIRTIFYYRGETAEHNQ